MLEVSERREWQDSNENRERQHQKFLGQAFQNRPTDGVNLTLVGRKDHESTD